MVAGAMFSSSFFSPILPKFFRHLQYCFFRCCSHLLSLVACDFETLYILRHPARCEQGVSQISTSDKGHLSQ